MNNVIETMTVDEKQRLQKKWERTDNPTIVDVTLFFPDDMSLKPLSIRSTTVPVKGSNFSVRSLGILNAEDGYDYEQNSQEHLNKHNKRLRYWKIKEVWYSVFAPASYKESLLCDCKLRAEVILIPVWRYIRFYHRIKWAISRWWNKHLCKS